MAVRYLGRWASSLARKKTPWMKSQALPLHAGTRDSWSERNRDTFAPWFSTFELSCPEAIHLHGFFFNVLYLFLAALVLCCCTGLSVVALCAFPVAVVSLAAEHRL